MLWLFLGFTTILSLIFFIIGVTWILVTRGTTHRRSGEEVGQEVMSTQMDEVVFFKGKAAAVEREASIGLDDIKTAIKTRQWGFIVALLMMILGLSGMCLCGGLSLLSVL
jgi:hypothetical protein